MNVSNKSPFAVERVVLFDRTGAETLVVAVKATYALAENGQMSLAGEQAPVQLVDTFFGEPAVSSLAEECEVGPRKPGTDVVLKGSAKAPRGSVQTMDVTFTVGSRTKQARVSGDRTWDTTLGMVHISPARPFESMPLTWENAFGGRDTTGAEPSHHEQEPRNPVGKGFRARKSKSVVAGSPLPNVEDPREPFKSAEQRVTPVGFGFVGRGWEPRLRYAGTYDAAWQESRMPLLPADFDDRFHHAAPAEFIFPERLQGGEPIQVQGCTRGGSLAFKLPRPEVEAELQFREGREPLDLKLDTVVVDTDAMQVRLLMKGEANVHRRLLRLSEIRIRSGREA